MPANNPFQVPPELWNLSITLPMEAIPYAEEAFAETALAVSSFEVEEGATWSISAIFDHEPLPSDYDLTLDLVASAFSIAKPEVSIHKIENEDWITKNLREFTPIHAGRFFVHGSHFGGSKPFGAHSIMVDAGLAFGSGEHETTKGCLEAISYLARIFRPKNALDVGSGSGILAIAIAKLMNAPTLAVDIDPIAVKVCTSNTIKNRVRSRVPCAVSDGYLSRPVITGGKYDLIAANILARPLMRMARHAKANLNKGGYIILSGLLTRQENMVLSAYKMQGLTLRRRIRKNGWSTLILIAL